MKIRPLLFASLLTATLSGMAFAGGPYGSIRVGNWIGGAYTNDVTGAFSHCAAIASYQGGINFAVGLGANNEWSLGFSHPSWTLVPGETIPITLTFDGRGPFNVFGIAQSPQIVIVAMPRNSVLMTEFRRSYVMTAFAKGSAFSLALTSTSQIDAYPFQLRGSNEPWVGAQQLRHSSSWLLATTYRRRNSPWFLPT